MTATTIRRVRPGFTLLEAAIALAIIGLAATGVMSSFAAQTRGAGEVRRTLELVALAQDVAARVALTDRVPGAPLADSLARGRFPAPFAEHAWEASIEPHRELPGLDIVTVRVIGPDGEFRAQELRARPTLAVAR